MRLYLSRTKARKASNNFGRISRALVAALMLVTAAGVTIMDAGPAAAVHSNKPPVAIIPNLGGAGYYVVASDGGVFSFGDAKFYGSKGGTTLNAPIVGAAERPGGGGYWLVGADGGVFAFGSAGFYGSMGGTTLNSPVVGIVPTPSGGGYWLVAKDGGIFSFGNAGFYGSMGGTHLNAPIVGMDTTATGHGYWLVGADGGIFTFGDAGYHGSLGGTTLNSPVVGMAATPSGAGYWLVAADGGVFTFGNAGFHGSMGGKYLNGAVVGMAATANGAGYWLTSKDGGVFTFGNAAFYGSVDVPTPPPASTGNGALRDAIANKARSQIGVAESPLGSNTIPGNPYGSNPHSWCADFSTWVWQQAGVNIPHYAFTGDIYSWAANAANQGHVRGASEIPKVGDQVLYGTSPANTSTSTHVNIIVNVNSTHTAFVTVGGNESDRVSIKGWHALTGYYAIVSPNKT